MTSSEAVTYLTTHGITSHMLNSRFCIAAYSKPDKQWYRIDTEKESDGTIDTEKEPNFTTELLDEVITEFSELD